MSRSGMTRNRLLMPLVLVLGAGAIWLMRAFLDDYVLSIFNFVGINIILASSLNLTNGFTGLFSLGHPGFMAVGGYVTAILTFPAGRKAMLLPALPGWLAAQEWTLLPATILGGLAASLTALVIGFPVLRLRGHYLAVATMGFLIIAQVLIINMDSYTRGPLGLNGLPMLTNLWWVYLWAVITVYVSLEGQAFLPGADHAGHPGENEMAAQCLGVPLARTRVLALSLGAFSFAGTAGGLWAHLITAITPPPPSLWSWPSTWWSWS